MGSIRLKLAFIKVFGTKAQFLRDSGSIPNDLSVAFANLLSIKPALTDFVVSILDGKRIDSVLGLNENVPVYFLDQIVLITFIPVAGFPYKKHGLNSRNGIAIGLLGPQKANCIVQKRLHNCQTRFRVRRPP